MADLINRQSAIDYCYALINAENPSDPSDEWNYSQERINQTEVILHHLEFMPPAQPETHEKRTETHACDLIDRQAAIDAVMEFMPSLTTPDGSGQFDREIFEAQEMFVDIGQALNELPSAQPETCDTCKHGYFGDTQCDNCCVRYPSHYERRTE